MANTTAPTPDLTQRPTLQRSAAITAAVLTMLLVVVTCSGAVYFGLLAPGPNVSTSSVLFTALFLAINITAAAAAVGLLRGWRHARTMLVGYVVWGVGFSIVKIVFWHETEAIIFVAASVVLGALTVAATPTPRPQPSTTGERQPSVGVVSGRNHSQLIRTACTPTR